MTFDEIKANKEEFLERNNVKETFEKSGVSWDTILKIGDDYEKKRYGNEGNDKKEYYLEILQRHIETISSFDNVHSWYYRIKSTESLMAKVIRKSAERSEDPIDVNNYYSIITDLLGLRILYVFKEDYWPLHQKIMEKYRNNLAEDVTVRYRQGDDLSIYQKLFDNYTNAKKKEGIYRSIHYVIYADEAKRSNYPRVEIQTRTVFEEGWSEISHRLVYKKTTGNLELKELSDVLSSMVGACDTIGMIMRMIHDTGIRANDDMKLPEEDSVTQAIRKFLQHEV